MEGLILFVVLLVASFYVIGLMLDGGWPRRARRGELCGKKRVLPKFLARGFVIADETGIITVRAEGTDA